MDSPAPDLNIEAPRRLPDLPQRATLERCIEALWQDSSVCALWIGGSLARGEGDRYSDLDLRIAVAPEDLDAWRLPDFDALFAGEALGHLFLEFGPTTFLHHLALANGDLLDLLVQSRERIHPEEAVVVLGCREVTLAERLCPPKESVATSLPLADPEALRQGLAEFWISTHKHRKVLHRGLHLVAQYGIDLDRAFLMRLWYALETGRDCGNTRRQTIHGLTEVARTIEQARGADCLAILGMPLTDPEHLCTAIERLRDEVATAGRLLAAKMGFAYPAELESMARRGWQEYREGSKR